ncbi:MAG: hypothetical protein J4F36_09495 [Nitrosopumilaceae archaeon]|nr:hypothetical protein [Nitrosopumilaceae archaeon]
MNKTLASAKKKHMAPLQQIKQGIPTDDITCQKHMMLAAKQDGKPACLKIDTLVKLMQRGWVSDELRLSHQYVCDVMDAMRLSHQYVLTVKEFVPSGTDGRFGGVFFDASAVRQWYKSYNGTWDHFHLHHCYFGNEDDMNNARDRMADFPTVPPLRE